MVQTLRYTLGRELSTVVETTGHEESIFATQYAQALSIIDRYVSDTTDEALHAVAFVGERGEGKTSCMKSVRAVLEKHSDAYLQQLGLHRLVTTKCKCLKVVDPAFFDPSRNVIELVLSQMYLDIKGESDLSDNIPNDLLEAFAKAKRCLTNLHATPEKMWDEVQELDDIASGIGLQKAVTDLVSQYLQHIKCGLLVVSIDDIDLNMGGAYRMCEHIRKYLAVPKCIVLISVRLRQLEKVVCAQFCKQCGDGLDVGLMARRYVEKLLPSSCHVRMPRVYDMLGTQLSIEDAENVPLGRDLKSAIVELIFRRTGYLFYNSRGGVSPIVPDNLRSLMHLVGLLAAMPSDRSNAATHESNKTAFKEYFYSEWSQQLQAEDRERAMELIEEQSETALNKRAVACLGEMMDAAVKKDYADDEAPTDAIGIAAAITNAANFAYNVSVGDVFYLINMLERDTLTRRQTLLLFFIKSFYSMRLYEAYDAITCVSVQDAPVHGTVYKEDTRFVGTNTLQRLLGGSYFTFNPGDLIAKSATNETFDKRFFNNAALARLLKKLLDGRNNIDAMFGARFRLAEFFILTNAGRVLSDKKEDHQARFRKNVTVFGLQPNTYGKGSQALFDSLSVFAHMVNPKYTYSLYNKEFRDIYQFAREHTFSLLSQMCEAVKSNRRHIGDDEPEADLHRLLSDAIVRNADVLAAMYETLHAERRKAHEAASHKAVATMYERITKSGMKTYDMTERGEPYAIEFHFLDPLRDFLRTIDDNADLKEDWDKMFLPDPVNKEVTNEAALQALIGKRVTVPKTIREKLVEANIRELHGEDLMLLVPDTPDDKGYTTERRAEVLHEVWAHIEARRTAAPQTD